MLDRGTIPLIALFFLIGAIAEAALVAHWPLDEGEGEIVQDVTGNGHEGAFNGNPIWVEGIQGSALEFDGQSHVSVPSVSGVKPESLTMAAWVYFNEVTTTRQDFLSRDDDYAFSLSEGSSDKAIHAIITTGGDWISTTGKTVLEADRWYYVTMTYGAGTNELISYLDGEEDGKIDAPAGLEHRRGGALTMGTFQDRYLKGKLDDFQIWDEALTEDQIKESMAQSATVDSVGKMAAVWAMLKQMTD